MLLAKDRYKFVEYEKCLTVICNKPPLGPIAKLLDQVPYLTNKSYLCKTLFLDITV